MFRKMIAQIRREKVWIESKIGETKIDSRQRQYTVRSTKNKAEKQLPLSHVVGVLEVYYLPSYAGSTPGQHCCMVATVNIYKSQ